MADPTKASTPKQTPRYRLTEKAYIGDILYDPATTRRDPETGEPTPLYIEYEGIPGPHMEAANDAARAMKDKYPQFQQNVNPIDTLTVVGGKTS